MIPLHDNIPTRRFPVMTTLLIAANVAVFLLDQLTQTQTQQLVGHAIDQYGRQVNVVRDISVGGITAHYSLVPAMLLRDPGHYWPTIFVSMFLHSNWLHIGGNMLYLWIFGNNVEDTLGRPRVLLFYFACGIVAAACQIATDPSSTIPMVGASGAIAGLMGAYLVLFPRAEILTIVPIFFIGALMEVPAIIVIGFWAVLNFVNAQWLGGGGLGGGGVAYFAHIGGFLAGILLILLLGGRRLLQQKGRDPLGGIGPYSGVPPRY